MAIIVCAIQVSPAQTAIPLYALVDVLVKNAALSITKQNVTIILLLHAFKNHVQTINIALWLVSLQHVNENLQKMIQFFKWNLKLRLMLKFKLMIKLKLVAISLVKYRIGQSQFAIQGFPVQTVIRLYALIDVLTNRVESSIIMHTVTQIFKSRFLKKNF